MYLSGFFVVIATKFKKIRLLLWRVALALWLIILRDRKSICNFKILFLCTLLKLCYWNWTKRWILWHLLVPNQPDNSFKKWKVLIIAVIFECTRRHSLRCSGREFFVWSSCMFSKFSLSFTPCCGKLFLRKVYKCF